MLHNWTFSRQQWSYVKSDSIAPLDTNSFIEWGSLTKFVTGYIVADLMKESKISHQDVVQIADKIFNIKDLLLHTSGLPKIPDNLNSYTNYTNEQIKDFVKSLGHIESGHFSYSNLGYALLAEKIESTTDISFESVVNHYLRNQFGLQNTFLLTGSKFFSLIKSGKKLDNFWYKDNYFQGSGGIISPLSSLQNFALSLSKNPGIKSYIQSIYESQFYFQDDSLCRAPGFVFECNQKNLITLIGLQGATQNFSVSISIHLEKDQTLLLIGSGEQDHSQTIVNWCAL